MLTRLPYTLLWILVLPLVLLRLLWRARRQSAYLRHVGERFGRYRVRAPLAVIWVHAVSVGETRAAEPLVRALLERWPDHSVLLTHMTPTGRDTARTLFKDEPRVLRAYLPYDIGCLVHAFLRHFRPMFGVVMETELWPNLLAACRRRRIPVMLANARLSARSARRYARVPALTELTMKALSAIGAQSAADAARLTQLGARRVTVTGNIKFDITPPPAMLTLGQTLRERIGTRPVVLAASTREGEEALLVDAFLRHAPADALLLLVPRHPQRFNAIAAELAGRKLAVQRRSANEPIGVRTRVLLGDSMGEMFAYYAAADTALIGGSWLPFGGQNLIEACAVGTPVVIGPHTFNFQAVAEDAVRAGAALRATDADDGMRRATALLSDTTRRETMSATGRAFAATHQGATARTVAILQGLLQAGARA